MGSVRITRLAAGALTFATLGAAHAAPGLTAPALTALRPLHRRLFPRLSGVGLADHVALTFDDGPDPAHTPALLDLLAARDVRATFFLLGPMAAAAPELAAAITQAGHEVGVHGWHHRYSVLTGPRAVRDDLTRARDTVAQACGAVPRWYRPPYGVLSAGALAAAHGLGLTPVLWTCWGREWAAGSSPGSVSATLIRTLTPGGTVLLHDSDCTSPAGSAAVARAALPRLLDECASRGLRVGKLSEHGL